MYVGDSKQQQREILNKDKEGRQTVTVLWPRRPGEQSQEQRLES
jgi:hypothetical protein